MPLRIADQAFKILMLALSGIGLAMLLILNLAIYFMIVRPITRLAKFADQTSTGELKAADIPANGNDEVSVLARSFNRMNRSLAQAIQMLEQ